MRNGRAMLIGILCVFFVVPAAFGQEQSNVASTPLTLSELQLTIIKEIHTSENKMRDHIDESEKDTREYIDDKFSKLSDKYSKIDKEVAVLNNAKWYIALIVAPISVYYSILLVQMVRKWNSNRTIEATSKDILPPEEPNVDMDNFLDNTRPDYQPARGKS